MLLRPDDHGRWTTLGPSPGTRPPGRSGGPVDSCPMMSCWHESRIESYVSTVSGGGRWGIEHLLGWRRKPHRAPVAGLNRRVERKLGAIARREERALGALGRTRARRLVLPGPDAVALDLAVGAEAKRVRRVGSSWDRAQRRSTSQSGLTSRTYVWTSRTASRAVLPATRAMRGRTWRS